jgi:hypothetical protein
MLAEFRGGSLQKKMIIINLGILTGINFQVIICMGELWVNNVDFLGYACIVRVSCLIIQFISKCVCGKKLLHAHAEGRLYHQQRSKGCHFINMLLLLYLRNDTVCKQ